MDSKKCPRYDAMLCGTRVQGGRCPCAAHPEFGQVLKDAAITKALLGIVPLAQGVIKIIDKWNEDPENPRYLLSSSAVVARKALKAAGLWKD